MRRLILLFALLASLAFTAQASALEPAPKLEAVGEILKWTEVVGATRYRTEKCAIKPVKSSCWPGAEKGVFTGWEATTRPACGPEDIAAKQELAYRVQSWEPEAKRSFWSNQVRVPCGSVEPSPEAGKVKFRIDAKTYADSIEIGFFAKFFRILGYPTAADRYAKAGDPTLGYHDAYTTWGSFGLNPTHRAEYVTKVERDNTCCEGHPYFGTFMDDIEWEAGYHQAGSEEEVASLIEAVRAGLGPAPEIEINSQWRDIYPRMLSGDPYVARALANVNQVDDEGGVLEHTGSKTLYKELFEYADALKAKGVHLDLTNAAKGDEYTLASYLLLNDGSDLVAGKPEPSTWWPEGFEANLGEPTSSREHSETGVWKRSFTGGVVYTVEPEASTQTIKFGAHHKLNGEAVSEATLAAKQGIVLLP